MNKLKQLLPYIPEAFRDYYLKNKYEKQFEKWEKQGRPLPPPHIVKQMVIRNFQEKHDIDTLIETGTYMGDMVYAQRNHFKKIYSIELSEKLWQMNQKRFQKYKHIETIQGDSGIVLESIIKGIDKKAIFWLDGHYSGGVTAKGETENPIIQELRTILKYGIEHIILIDDARCFDGTHDYPTVEQVKILILEGGFPYSILELGDDIIKIELKA